MATKEELSAVPHRVPKDISAIWKGDVDSFVKQNFITFTAYDSPTISISAVDTQTAMSHPGKALESWSFLWPRTGFKESISHNYSATRSSLVAEILAGAKKGVSSIKESVNDTFNGLTGRPTTNLLKEDPIFFQKTERRKFDITINLYSISSTKDENNNTVLDLNSDIYEPIQFFKKYSHPEIKNDKLPGTTFKYPGTFTISGGIFDNQSFMTQDNKTSRGQLILVSLGIDYSPEVKFLDPLGLPVNATLNLSFEEITSKTKIDYSEKLSNSPKVNIHVKK